jgi:hypothetical protein
VSRRNAWQAPLGSPDLVEAIIDGRYTLGNDVRHIKSRGWQVEASGTPDEVALSSCTVYCCKLSQKSWYRLEALLENIKRTAQALCYSHARLSGSMRRDTECIKDGGHCQAAFNKRRGCNQEEKMVSGLSAGFVYMHELSKTFFVNLPVSMFELIAPRRKLHVASLL